MFIEAEKDRKESIVGLLGFSLFTIATLGISAILFYEAFVETPYWINRWRLRRALRRGEVEIIEKKMTLLYNIIDLTVRIKGEEYTIWIYPEPEDNMTLSSVDHDRNYIGLFTGSVTTKWLKRDAIRRLNNLLEEKMVLN